VRARRDPAAGPRKQAQRFARLHRVDRLANGLRRQDAVDPRRHEPDAVEPALQERPEVLLAPRLAIRCAGRRSKRCGYSKMLRRYARRLAGHPRPKSLPAQSGG